MLGQLSEQERDGSWRTVSWLGSRALRDCGQAGLTPALPLTAPVPHSPHLPRGLQLLLEELSPQTQD